MASVPRRTIFHTSCILMMSGIFTCIFHSFLNQTNRTYDHRYCCGLHIPHFLNFYIFVELFPVVFREVFHFMWIEVLSFYFTNLWNLLSLISFTTLDWHIPESSTSISFPLQLMADIHICLFNFDVYFHNFTLCAFFAWVFIYLSLEFERQQVSSSHQNSFEYSSQS